MPASRSWWSGGGNSAGQAAVFLAARASTVRLVVREPDLGTNMSRYLVDRLERMPGVEILLDSEVRRLDGDRELRRVEVENNRTGERQWVDARALFVFIGAEPHTRWLGEEVAVDEHSFVLAGPDSVAAVAPSRRRAPPAASVRDDRRRRVRGR